MQRGDIYYDEAIAAKVRHLEGRATIREADGTYVEEYAEDDNLKSFEIQRIGEESKFFGFGVAARLNLKLIDKDREINYFTTSHTINPELRAPIEKEDTIYSNSVSFPTFYVTEVNRDENTNELSITAYDKLKEASMHTIQEVFDSTSVTLAENYNMKEMANAIAQFLGVSCDISGSISNDFESYTFIGGANLDGTETLRQVLDAIAEATQTIYYMNLYDKINFIRLKKDTADTAVKTITKEDYITLESGDNRRLATICHATELGDNVSASTTEIGTTQYVRDNPFWDLREDIADVVNTALDRIGGITINQFECTWRGDPRLEPGDKIALVTKDNKTVISYFLNDTLTYDGSYSQKTEWKYSKSGENEESNPTSIGETIKKTYARVDKVNKQIELVASEVGENGENISSLQQNVNNITASVKKVEKSTNEALSSVNNNIQSLTKRVDAAVTAEDVKIQVKSELNDGVTKVTTSTGFTFNEEGLTVSKSGSEMTTTITEDGMTVYRDSEAMLTANNEGVDAVNLHATTYLIIGTNSRFEDYEKDGEARTACFWIGESEVDS